VEKGGSLVEAIGLSTAGIVVALLIAVVGSWEQARPEHPDTELAGPRWRANLALFALGAGGWFLIRPLVFQAVAVVGAWPDRHGLGLHALVIIPALDCADYLLHRIWHRVPWLWRLHAIHHTDTALDVTTTLRHHPVEVFLGGMLFAAIALLIGASAAEMAAYGLILFTVQLVAHANVALPPALERALGGVLVTPSFHRFHHSRERHQSDANYGQILSLWDRLFGTLAPHDGRAAPAAFGVNAFLAPRFRTVAAMLLQPAARAARPNPKRWLRPSLRYVRKP
jgi:sterol desaturase/sphingolipid hydroxylase (fatty acid hydroxylase superfamily)